MTNLLDFASAEELTEVLARFRPGRVGDLIEPRPIDIIKLGSWGDNPVTLSVLLYTNGFLLCKFNTKTGASVSIGQALFPTINAARKWARQAHSCGYRFNSKRRRVVAMKGKGKP